VLVSVNNEKVTSQDQITSLANKYKNASVVRIAFLRDGQLMNTTYRLRS
jgi:S1-C subfamily serine protease